MKKKNNEQRGRTIIRKRRYILVNNNMTFEDFLKEQHAADYIGIDDDMPDDFEDWLGGQSSEDFIKLADLWTKNVIEFVQIRVKQIKGVYSAHDALEKVDEVLANLLKK